MKFKGTKLSKRTVALLAAALVLLGSGGYVGTKAELNVMGENYNETIFLDSLDVGLYENGEHVGSQDEPGVLLESLEKADPGKSYDDVISVKNDGTADEYIRVIVRKYWTNDKGKDCELDPALIELKPEKGWKEVKDDEHPEYATYYYSKKVSPGDGEINLFTSVRINEKVKTEGKLVTEEKKGNKTVYTYTYQYDGYNFNVEAEAQAVQTHSADKAIKSIWGVDAGEVGINL